MTTKARKAALLAYVLECRDLFRLQAWDIEVGDGAGVDETLRIDVQLRRHHAIVRVGQFFSQEPDEQRQTVAHEMIHLVQGRMLEFFNPDGKGAHEGWRGPMAPDAIAALEAFIEEEIEVQADFMARIIAPLLPMPPKWPSS